MAHSFVQPKRGGSPHAIIQPPPRVLGAVPHGRGGTTTALQPKRIGAPGLIAPPPAHLVGPAHAGSAFAPIQRKANGAHGPGPGQIIQAKYWLSTNGVLTKSSWPAMLTPGIEEKRDANGRQETGVDGLGIWWTTIEANATRAAARLAAAGHAAHAAVGQVAIAIGGNNPPAAANLQQQQPQATSMASIVGKALLAAGVVTIAAIIVGPVLKFAFPPVLKQIFNWGTLGGALARGLRNRYKVRQATRAGEPVWQINFRDGVNVTISAAMFWVEYSQAQFGLAFSGWLEELYDLIKWIGTAIRSCCGPADAIRQPLLQH